MRLPNPRWDNIGWYGDWSYPDPEPPGSIQVYPEDDPEPVGEILGADGAVIRKVFAARKPFGFCAQIDGGACG